MKPEKLPREHTLVSPSSFLPTVCRHSISVSLECPKRLQTIAAASSRAETAFVGFSFFLEQAKERYQHDLLIILRGSIFFFFLLLPFLSAFLSCFIAFMALWHG